MAQIFGVWCSFLLGNLGARAVHLRSSPFEKILDGVKSAAPDPHRFDGYEPFKHAELYQKLERVAHLVSNDMDEMRLAKVHHNESGKLNSSLSQLADRVVAPLHSLAVAEIRSLGDWMHGVGVQDDYSRFSLQFRITKENIVFFEVRLTARLSLMQTDWTAESPLAPQAFVMLGNIYGSIYFLAGALIAAYKDARYKDTFGCAAVGWPRGKLRESWNKEHDAGGTLFRISFGVQHDGPNLGAPAFQLGPAFKYAWNREYNFTEGTNKSFHSFPFWIEAVGVFQNRPNFPFIYAEVGCGQWWPEGQMCTTIEPFVGFPMQFIPHALSRSEDGITYSKWGWQKADQKEGLEENKFSTAHADERNEEGKD